MKKPILFSILGLISLTMLSLFSGCIKSPEGPPTHEDSINAYRCFEIVQEYLPYTEGDSLIFASGNGQKDTLVCARLTGESYGAKIRLNRVKEWNVSTDTWILSSQHLYCNVRAYGSEIYYDGVSYVFSGYIRDSVNAGRRDFYQTLPEVESILELYPEILLESDSYINPQQLPSGSYMKIRYHKGLTEFSLDGQEIWRLVEE